jgi:hypothetical protein
LSKRFYEVLGEDVANELVDWFNAVDLTYRTDLRELNELNFARFDARLEQRVAQLEQRIAQLEQSIAQLEQRLEQGLAGLRADLHSEQAVLRADLRSEWKQDLAALRVDLIRWMFGFWVTTLMAVAGLVVALRGG